MVGEPSSQACELQPLRFRAGCGMLHGEPELEEILSEPIVLMVARRDGVSGAQLRALCERIRWRLRYPVMLNQA